jgi:hypothetical protein
MIDSNSDDMLQFMQEYLLSYVFNSPIREDITFGYAGMTHQVVTSKGTITAELSYDGMSKLVAMHKATLAEAEIRNKNEAVQYAYEQYQILLKLAQ